MLKVFGFVRRHPNLTHDEYRTAHVGYHNSFGRRLPNIRGYLLNVRANRKLDDILGTERVAQLTRDEPDDFDDLWDGWGQLLFDSRSILHQRYRSFLVSVRQQDQRFQLHLHHSSRPDAGIKYAIEVAGLRTRLPLELSPGLGSQLRDSLFRLNGFGRIGSFRRYTVLQIPQLPRGAAHHGFAG